MNHSSWAAVVWLSHDSSVLGIVEEDVLAMLLERPLRRTWRYNAFGERHDYGVASCGLDTASLDIIGVFSPLPWRIEVTVQRFYTHPRPALSADAALGTSTAIVAIVANTVDVVAIVQLRQPRPGPEA